MDILIKLRKERGISTREMAEIFNVSKSTYNHWETGRSEPSISYLKALSDFFCVSIDFLINGTLAPIHATLPEDESELLSLFRALTQEDKRGVMRIARSLAKDVKGVSVPKAN